MLGLLSTRVEGPCWGTRAQKQGFFIQGHSARGQILSGEIPLPKIQCVTAANAKEHEKPECSCAETKYLGSSMPQTSKESSWLRSTCNKN